MLTFRTVTATTTGTGISIGTIARTTTGIAAVAALAAGHAGVDMVTGSISAMLPTLEARFGLSGSAVATLLATLSASSMLSQPLIGRIADRIGARAVAAGGAFIAASLLSLLGIVNNVGLLYALLIVGGLGSAGFHPAAAAAARKVLPERASLAISIFSAGGMVGMAFGPIAALLLIAHAGIGATPLLMAPGAAMAAGLWLTLPDDPPRGAGTATAARARLLRGPVGPVAGAGMFVALATTTLHAGLPMWLSQRADTRSATLGLAFVAYELAAAAGGILSASVARRIAPAWIAAAALGAAPLPLLGLFVTAPGSFGFYVAAAAAGALMNAATPLLMVAAQERSDGAVAAASGLMGFATGAAGIAFVGIGALIDTAGLGTGLIVGFGFLIPAAAIASRALERHPVDTPAIDLVAAGCGDACACL
jgi:FSR family fosmidomycin resistance protein-like MFS transporter